MIGGPFLEGWNLKNKILVRFLSELFNINVIHILLERSTNKPCEVLIEPLYQSLFIVFLARLEIWFGSDLMSND